MDNPKPDATTDVPAPESPELIAERQRKVTAETMHQPELPMRARLDEDDDERQSER